MAGNITRGLTDNAPSWPRDDGITDRTTADGQKLTQDRNVFDVLLSIEMLLKKQVAMLQFKLEISDDDLADLVTAMDEQNDLEIVR